MLVFFTSLTVCSGDNNNKKALKMKKKKKLWKWPVNWSFSELIFHPPNPKSKKNPVNQLIKKSSLMNQSLFYHFFTDGIISINQSYEISK